MQPERTLFPPVASTCVRARANQFQLSDFSPVAFLCFLFRRNAMLLLLLDVFEAFELTSGALTNLRL